MEDWKPKKYITAGELRRFGFSISALTPDHAMIEESSLIISHSESEYNASTKVTRGSIEFIISKPFK